MSSLDKVSVPLADHEDLARGCARAFSAGLVSASSGNASFRSGGRIFMTATGVSLSSVGEGAYAVVEMDGSVVSGVPSKELSAHRALYNAQSEVQAVLHVHGVYIAAYSCIVAEGDNDYPAVGAAAPLKVSDRLPVVPYSHTNMRGDYENFLAGAQQGPVFLQRNHGVFVGARSIADALTNATMLEANFQVFFIAASSGRPMTILSPEDKATLSDRSYPTNLDKRHVTY